MTDVFISYSRRDREVALRLAESLERDGCSVWWDDRIEPSARFRTEVERELDAARTVVVLWSKASVESDWVRAEAGEAQSQRKLVPAALGQPHLPPPFGRELLLNLGDAA